MSGTAKNQESEMEGEHGASWTDAVSTVFSSAEAPSSTGHSSSR